MSVADALDSGDDALLLEDSDVDVWRDMWSDDVGGDSSLVGVGVCLCQLLGGVGGGGNVRGDWLSAGRRVWVIWNSNDCWGRRC